MSSNTKKNRKIIRIGFIFNHSFFLGGGEISLFELIRKLDKKRFKPIVIVPGSGEIGRKLQCNNIEVHSIPFPPLREIITLSPIKSFFYLIKFFKKHRIDLIHANGSRVCFYCAIAGRILKTPVIWHVRESFSDLFYYDWLLANLATIIICVSKSVQKKRFKRFGENEKDRIAVVYNGVDTSKFHKNFKNRSEARNKLDIKPSVVLFGLIGNIIQRKSQDFFIKAFARAKQIQPDISAKVLIIGHFFDEKYLNYLRQLVTDLNLHSNIIFREFTDDISKILSGIDIFVLSSKSEGFCRSLLEAMSCGLPIIATRLSEIEEAIIDTKNGLLVDFMNIEKMSSAVIMLCKSKRLCNEIGTYNRLVAERKFSLITHVKSIESIYLNIFRKSRHYLC